MSAPLLSAPVEPEPGPLAHSLWIAWLALAFSLAFTLLSWFYVRDSADREASMRFESATLDVGDVIRKRMSTYEQVLRGGVALFAASVSVDRHAWKRFVEASHVEQRFPGIQGMSFARVVSAREREAHIGAIRAEGYPDYGIHPEGERPEYVPVVYMEPFSGRNLRAFGYDLFSEAARRAALERARDTGEAIVTAKLVLVQETEHERQAGFLMELPVYRNGAPKASVAERRAALVGYVNGTFRMNDLMRGILGARTPQLNLEIYDGTEVSPAALMYDDGLHRSGRPRFARNLALETGGRAWTLRLSSTPEFESLVATRHPLAILMGGIALSVLVFLLVISFNGLQRRTRLLVARDAELRESRKHLDSLLRAKSEFMANVTHELRTPLNSVIGFAGLLKDEVPGPLNAKQAQFAADILASGERLLALVEAILEMSRLDTAGAALEREPVEIGQAIEERLAARRKAAEAHGVTIALELAPGVGSAELGRNALRRMLDALIDNAIKFNREGGTVAVSARRDNGWLEIAVADTGIGIACEDLAKLFKPLVQLDAGLARRQGGVGLGLALARRLAELHGGTIEVESERGTGSKFTLRLPITEC